MSEMVERVARAIQEDRDPSSSWDHMSNLCREDYLGHARAAIEAMREPTEAMIRAGMTDHGNGFYSREPVKEEWQNMIDEALR